MSAISVSWLDVSWGAVIIETNCGLMQHSYIEIKDRLLKALDSEYNVVDMATVFDVVAVLEKTPITPEILESTRLGKVINECRRRTKNEALARRAKHLVRRWRNMMVVGNAAAAATSAPPTTASSSSSTTSLVPQQNGTNLRSPNMMTRVGAVAAISPSFSLSSSSSASSARADRVPLSVAAASVSPALSSGGGNAVASAAASRSSYSSSSYSVSNKSNHHHHSCGSNSGGGAYTGPTNLVSPSLASSVSASAMLSRSPLRDSKVESVSKTCVANKRLRKKAGSSSPTEPPTKKAKINGVLLAGQQHQQKHQYQLQYQQSSPPLLQQQHYHSIRIHQMQQQQQHDDSRLLSPPSTFGSVAFSDIAGRLGDTTATSSCIVTSNDADDASLAAPPEGCADDVEYQQHVMAAVAESIPEPEPDPPPIPSTSKKRSRKKANKKNRSEDDIVREKLQALSKTGRVKTTEELMAELKSLKQDRLSSVGACLERALTPSDIGSVTSTTVKPSLSNVNCSSSSSTNINSNKNVVAQLQRHTEHCGGGDDNATIDCTAGSSGAVALHGEAVTPCEAVPIEQLDAEARVEREIADILARLPPLSAADIRWDETPVPSPPTSPAPPPTDEQVERYLRQRWDGVNGCVTHGLPDQDDPQRDAGFREWHEMVARRTINDDLIHILPYSIVD